MASGTAASVKLTRQAYNVLEFSPLKSNSCLFLALSGSEAGQPRRPLSGVERTGQGRVGTSPSDPHFGHRTRRLAADFFLKSDLGRPKGDCVAAKARAGLKRPNCGA